MSDSVRRSRVDYGLDAPGTRNGMLRLAVGGIVVASIAGAAADGAFGLRTGLFGGMLAAIAYLGIVACVYGAWMASYMTWSSKIGKLQTRDTLLERAGRLRPWCGDEVVVDVGCGRGLMLIGAARYLRTGNAVGVDLWRGTDQSTNTPEAVAENARREGVADRVEIRTADARELPFADDSVDIVLSHWVVHNIASEADRRRALDEMWRILRPGGIIVLADIAHVPTYARHLTTLGAISLEISGGGTKAQVMDVLSGGTYRPQALLCLKPA